MVRKFLATIVFFGVVTVQSQARPSKPESKFDRDELLSFATASGTTREPLLGLLGQGAAQASYEGLLQNDYIIKQNKHIIEQNEKIIELLESK